MNPWTLSQISQHRPRHRVSKATREMSVVGTDSASNFTIGFDGANKFILVGPQLEEYEAFETEFARLDTNLSFRTQDLPANAEPYFRLTFFVEDEEQLSCASAIVLGLNDMARVNHEALPLESIRELVFSGFSSCPIELETGLFGELISMLASGNVQRAALAWHSNASEIFDFEDDGTYFEVKTSLGGRRQHWFSESQLRKVAGPRLRFISILTSLSNSGVSCREISSEISELLSPSAREHFDNALSNYPILKMTRKFDKFVALESCNVYQAPLIIEDSSRPLMAIDAKYQLDLEISCVREVEGPAGWLSSR